MEFVGRYERDNICQTLARLSFSGFDNAAALRYTTIDMVGLKL